MDGIENTFRLRTPIHSRSASFDNRTVSVYPQNNIRLLNTQSLTKSKSLDSFPVRENADRTSDVNTLPPENQGIELQLSSKIKSTLAKISNTTFFERCTDEEQHYIIQYGTDMIQDGYKAEFAVQICAAMAILYQDRDLISSLPKTINIYTIAFDGAEGRKNIIAKMQTIMGKHGADYSIIKNYLEGQQSNSWSNQSLIMKAFYLQQRLNPQTMENFYLNKYSPQELIELYTSNVKDKQKYFNTVAMYKALTAIALNNLNEQDAISQQKHTISLERRVNHFTTSDKQGIADSAAWKGQSQGRFGRILLKMEIPFSKVHAVFFYLQNYVQIN